MKTILYIVSSLSSGGTTTQLFNLVSGIDRNEYELYIMTLSPEGARSRKPDFLEYATVISLDLGRAEFWRLPRLVFDEVLKINPDIVHSHTFRPDCLNAYLARSGLKTVSTIHSHSGEFFRQTYGIPGYLFFQLHKWSQRNIDVLISCSASVARYTENVVGNLSDVIYNGTNIVLSESGVHDAIIKRQQNNVLKLVYVGSLTKLKNINFLIDSFIKCNSDHRFELVLLGDGPLLDYARNFGAYGVKAMGNVEDVEAHLLGADLVVSASTSEGMPMAIIEAMSYGVPALLSNIPSHRELIELNTNAGLTFEFKPGDFAEKLSQLTEPRVLKEASFEAYRLACRVFDSKFMCLSYQELYQKIISGEATM